MKQFLCIIALLCFSTVTGGAMLYAQQGRIVKSGEISVAFNQDLAEVLPDDVVFMYSQFQQGSVMFNSKTSAQGEFNIFLLSGDLQFIDPYTTDTLTLVNQEDVRMVNIGRDYYIRHKGQYVRLLSLKDNLALGISTKVSIDNNVKTGAYGDKNSTSSIESLSSTDMFGVGSSPVVKLRNLHDIPYTITHTPYLYTKDKLVTANRKNFIKCFPGREAAIEQFVKENNIHFDKAREVLSLFNYLSNKE